jgi:hypothetical protein
MQATKETGQIAAAFYRKGTSDISDALKVLL